MINVHVVLRFAVAGQAFLQGTLAPVTVWHVPVNYHDIYGILQRGVPFMMPQSSI